MRSGGDHQVGDHHTVKNRRATGQKRPDLLPMISSGRNVTTWGVLQGMDSLWYKKGLLKSKLSVDMVD